MDETQLDSVYYQIDSYTPLGSNTTGWTSLFTSLSNASANASIEFSSEAWLDLSQGYHRIYFKIRDHISNYYEGEGANYEFFKDTAPPEIIFNNLNYSYYNEAPTLDIDVIDSTGLDSAYYDIDISTFGDGNNVTGWTEIVFNHTTDSYTDDFLLNTTIWNNLTEGEHIIYVKAWDDLGNKILSPEYNWTFYKDLTSPTYVIDANMLTNYTVYRERPKIYSKYTDLMGGNPGNLSNGYYKIDSPLPAGENLNGWNSIFSDADFSIKEDGFYIDATVWDDLSDGIHTLYIKVFDDAGNADDNCLQSFIFEKDTTDPGISLNNGTDYYSTIDTFDVNISIDTTDAVWAQYKWNDAAEYSNFTTDFLAIASSLPEGINILWVTAWDEVSNPTFPAVIEIGNTNVQSYQFIVDQSAPNITFITTNNSAFNFAPTFNVDFWDNFTLDSAYYVIDVHNANGTTTTGWIELFSNSSLDSTSVEFSLNSTQWNQLSEGPHYIYVKVWDDLLNVNETAIYRLLFIKDTQKPTYVINSTQNQFYSNPPMMNVTFYDDYGVETASYQIDGGEWVELFSGGSNTAHFSSIAIQSVVLAYPVAS
jgi:hypothetical protein